MVVVIIADGFEIYCVYFVTFFINQMRALNPLISIDSTVCLCLDEVRETRGLSGDSDFVLFS